MWAALNVFRRLNQSLTRRPILRFLLILALFMGLFYACLPWLFNNCIIPTYLQFNARASAAVLTWLGHAATANAAYVSSSRFSFEIRQGCDASEPTALFVAAIIAWRARWTSKLVGIISGTAILAFVNLLRIIALYFTGAYWPSAFETMHLDVWQAVFIVLTLSLWIGWALWATRAQPKLAPATSEAVRQ